MITFYQSCKTGISISAYDILLHINFTGLFYTVASNALRSYCKLYCQASIRCGLRGRVKGVVMLTNTEKCCVSMIQNNMTIPALRSGTEKSFETPGVPEFFYCKFRNHIQCYQK